MKRDRRRAVVAEFEAGRLTTDAGLRLLREVDRKLGQIDVVNPAIADPKGSSYVIHQQRELLAQRIFAVAAGYERRTRS